VNIVKLNCYSAAASFLRDARLAFGFSATGVAGVKAGREATRFKRALMAFRLRKTP